ncbi:zinc finger protein 98 [Trichonephila inaurata madagascariensis]|uniref:Zinc finger protein 98 n=1 Tax=Trichonephila inaurata madagascariensis TaxID=2747483 RepID=A0A8X6KEB5_9ARAC|nr:zinc finger protein 98 [Trichonephila inaurata madagascariensis]
MATRVCELGSTFDALVRVRAVEACEWFRASVLCCHLVFNRLNGIGGNFGFECLKALCEICPSTSVFDVTFVLLNDSAANVQKNVRNFRSKSSFKRMKLYHGDKKTLSFEEVITFSEKRLLTTHKRQHTGEKPSESAKIFKQMTVHNSRVNTKPFVASESVESVLDRRTLEGIPLHHEESQESNSLSYISEQAFACSEGYTNEQIMPSSEFSINSFPHQSASNFNLIHDGNCAIQNNSYGSNPCDISLNKWSPANCSNFDEIFLATDSKISESNNKYLNNNLLQMCVDLNVDSRTGINFVEDKKQCPIASNEFLREIPFFQFKDARILDCEKYSQMPDQEVILNEQKQFHGEERNSKMVDYSENTCLKTGFIREKDLYEDIFDNSPKLFPEGSNFKETKLSQKQTDHFKCEECQKYLSSKSSLYRHRLIHTGIKPFQCEKCHQTFNQKSNLTTHKRIHTGQKPFECEKCHRTFNQKGNLTTHKCQHTGKKPFECEVCHRSFNDKSNLSRHKRTKEPFSARYVIDI